MNVMGARRRNKAVNAVVIGDEGVGKTSLITAAATESFPDFPPPVLPPTRLPAEATPEGVPMIITDTSSREEEKTSLDAACNAADVIVLLFATDRGDALARIGSHWLPELRRIGVRAPVILVGTKSDLKSADHNLQQAVVHVMSNFKEIETCLECSAKNLVFVAEVFYYAVKAVVHPTAALFDAMTQTLKPLCVNALRRIFMMCDVDKDDALDDAELNAFQVRCFNAPLQPEELMGVKKVVQDKMPQGVNAKGLTLSGFLFLHALFIERGRLETTWAVLRKFGYNDELRICDELLDAVSFQHSPDQVVELTDAGRDFLRSAFRRADRDRDGALSAAEQDDMWSTAPASPWVGAPQEGLLVEAGPDGLTLAGFLARWAALTVRQPRRALEHMMYLGFEGDASALFRTSRPRRAEQRSKGDAPVRSVYQGLVIGGASVGKSTLLARLAKAPGSGSPGVGSGSGSGIAAAAGPVIVKRPGLDADVEVTLLLRELNEGACSALLQSPSCASVLAATDFAVFVFDSTSLASFRTAHQLMLAVAQAAGDALPCVFLAAKDDLGMSQDLVEQCGSAFGELRLRPPMPVSLRSGEAGPVFSQLLGAAQDPEPHIPLTPSLKAALQYRRTVRRTLLYTAAGAGAALAAYFGWRWYNTHYSGDVTDSSGSGESLADSARSAPRGAQ